MLPILVFLAGAKEYFLSSGILALVSAKAGR